MKHKQEVIFYECIYKGQTEKESAALGIKIFYTTN